MLFSSVLSSACRLAEETPKAASHLLIQAVEENLAPALQRHILQPATFQALVRGCLGRRHRR